MRFLVHLTAAAVAAATMTATTAQATTTTTQEIRSLRSGIAWARQRTWHWQSVAGISHSPTIRGAALYHSPGYLRWIQRKWNRRRLHAYKLAHRPRPMYRTLSNTSGSVQTVICQVFGPYCSQALAVARCESGFSITAVNGIYYGLFQLGATERATYGEGRTALGETQAAYRYFVASGRDWSPWSCKP